MAERAVGANVGLAAASLRQWGATTDSSVPYARDANGRPSGQP